MNQPKMQPTVQIKGHWITLLNVYYMWYNFVVINARVSIDQPKMQPTVQIKGRNQSQYYTCTVCHKTLRTEFALRVHEQTHKNTGKDMMKVELTFSLLACDIRYIWLPQSMIKKKKFEFYLVITETYDDSAISCFFTPSQILWWGIVITFVCVCVCVSVTLSVNTITQERIIRFW